MWRSISKPWLLRHLVGHVEWRKESSEIFPGALWIDIHTVTRGMEEEGGMIGTGQ